MTISKYDRVFLKRLNVLRRWLIPRSKWTEGLDVETGTMNFWLANSIPFDFRKNTTPPELGVVAVGTKHLQVPRPLCSFCNESWGQHAPPGEKCLFGATSYHHGI